MSITTGTKCKFYFYNAAQFGQKITDGQLTPGSLYFVGQRVYLALTGNTFQQFGSFRSVAALPDPSVAEAGVIYYNQATKLISVVNGGAWEVVRRNHLTSIFYLSCTPALAFFWPVPQKPGTGCRVAGSIAARKY